MLVPLLAVLVCEAFDLSPDLSLSTRTHLHSVLMLLVVCDAVDEKRIAVCHHEPCDTCGPNTGCSCWKEPQHQSVGADLWQSGGRKREWREEGRMSRVERQTCDAMTFLATGVSPHTSLLHAVYGLKYSLLETKALANLVRNNWLKTLRVCHCRIRHKEVSDLSLDLQQKTLTVLDLTHNILVRGMYALAHNTTLQVLYLRFNRHSGEAAARLRQQLTHIQIVAAA